MLAALIIFVLLNNIVYEYDNIRLIEEYREAISIAASKMTGQEYKLADVVDMCWSLLLMNSSILITIIIYIYVNGWF